TVLDQMLADRRVADAKRRALRTAVGDEAVRVERKLAVPVVRDLDPVETAVIRPEECLGARQRLERRIARLPFLSGTRDRRDTGPPERARFACAGERDYGGKGREHQSSNAHATFL